MKSGKGQVHDLIEVDDELWIDDGWADYLYWQSQDKNLAEELTKLTGLSMPLMKMGFYG